MRAQKMEGTIWNALDNYLYHKIIQKIEIKSIVAGDFIDGDSNKIFKAYGISELLKLCFDIILQQHLKKFQEILEIFVKILLIKK